MDGRFVENLADGFKNSVLKCDMFSSKHKHIVITQLFDSGGSNSHFKNLVSYLGQENVILILEDKDQLVHLNRLIKGSFYQTFILYNLHKYAHLRYKLSTNIKELLFILKSILLILYISFKHGRADLIISAVEPEKYLYFLWLPFVRVHYILHTEPLPAFTPFTTFTCNSNLGKNKRIITVSNSMKTAIITNWKIKDKKDPFISVIYNCIAEEDFVIKTEFNKIIKEELILTMGHVDLRKNPSLWLEVAKVIIELRPTTKFIWLGNGPLLTRFRAASVSIKNIDFLGLNNNQQSYLEQASIYYQPSLIEPQGIAVLEAMHNQLPCVVANIGGLPESVQHQINGIVVDPRDLEENVKAIISLLDNRSLRAVYGINSYNRYKQLFTYQSFKTNMDALYN